jgi:hypothetical protein
MQRIIMPTDDGYLELDVISLPASAFSGLRAWEALGDFEAVEPVDSSLS